MKFFNQPYWFSWLDIVLHLLHGLLHENESKTAITSIHYYNCLLCLFEHLQFLLSSHIIIKKKNLPRTCTIDKISLYRSNPVK